MEAYKTEVTRLRSNDKTFLSYLNSEREKYENDSESSILKKNST